MFIVNVNFCIFQFHFLDNPERDAPRSETLVAGDSIYNELKKNTVTSAKIALSCKISSQDTMTDSKVHSDSIIVFYALELV